MIPPFALHYNLILAIQLQYETCLCAGPHVLDAYANMKYKVLTETIAVPTTRKISRAFHEEHVGWHVLRQCKQTNV